MPEAIAFAISAFAFAISAFAAAYCVHPLDKMLIAETSDRRNDACDRRFNV
ncbi:hypothetical protein H6G91_01295 [Nostoc muscorum FACHB-395]|uniref:hypothetical protein n=1 Tax=Nostoc sp. C057 TaxID=2576903 RepID=UPI0015C3DB16|nr:hypothetical protein [Nostoc sp. C057]MBD2505918.1 hypothetical protein [Desmonostoc muscorum FACHB-395]